MLGSCNSVGAIGFFLGGGISRLQANYGLRIDNMISERLITAQGNCITVSATENPDLWWGLRGAGHNFGIVSELTVKAHPQINEGMQFCSTLVFDPAKIVDRATFAKPHQYAVGMRHVFVNGAQVLKDGEHTGAKPGRALWGPGKQAAE